MTEDKCSLSVPGKVWQGKAEVYFKIQTFLFFFFGIKVLVYVCIYMYIHVCMYTHLRIN